MVTVCKESILLSKALLPSALCGKSAASRPQAFACRACCSSVSNGRGKHARSRDGSGARVLVRDGLGFSRRGHGVGRRKRGTSTVVAAWWFQKDPYEGKTEEEIAAMKEEEKKAEEEKEKEQKIKKLVFSIAIDVIGILTDSDLLGGKLDYGWGPISALIIQRLYAAPLLTTANLAEEWLPGTDLIPTATIGWCVENIPQLAWISRIPFMGSILKRKKQTGKWLPFL